MRRRPVSTYAPFGGEKESSYGSREQGPAVCECDTRTVTVTLSRDAHAVPFGG
jgi:aldehyde dehydrogenase (NAD+)